MNRRFVWILGGREVQLSLRRAFRSARATARRVRQRHAHRLAVAILRALVAGARLGG